jgi:hypothetical protein
VYVAGVAGFGLLLAMVVLLTMLLGVLRDSQVHIRDTDARITRIEKNSAPVLSAADPAVRQIAPTLRQARPLLREARPLVREARGLLGPLGVAVEGITAAADRLPALFADVSDLADVARSDRLRVGLDALPQLRVLPHLEALAVDLHQKTVDLDQKTGRGLELQLASLRVQQRSLRVQFRTLATADETLQHTRSIDAKLGGQLPTSAGAP